MEEERTDLKTKNLIGLKKVSLLDSCPHVAFVPENEGVGALDFYAGTTEPFPFVDHEATHPHHFRLLHTLLLDVTVGALVRHLLPIAGDEVEGGAVLPLAVDRADLGPSDDLPLHLEESQASQ